MKLIEMGLSHMWLRLGWKKGVAGELHFSFHLYFYSFYIPPLCLLSLFRHIYYPLLLLFLFFFCQLSATPTAQYCLMADYHYGGSEEENAELRKLETDLVCPSY